MPAVLGVLGGMGPLASARFLRTLYEADLADNEAGMPHVLLDSNPRFPDRTAAIMAAAAGHPAQLDTLADLVAERLRRLLDAGADRLVMACFTAHHLLDRLDPALRAALLSLVGLTLDGLAEAPGRLLMLSTTGTRQARIFERAPGWGQVAGRVAFPAGDDQDTVHQLIYRLKRGERGPSTIAVVDVLMRRYGCTGAVLGCTEFHLMSAELVARYGRRNVVDALLGVAENLPGLTTPTFATPQLCRNEVTGWTR